MVVVGHWRKLLENKMFYGVPGRFLQIHKNKRCEAANSMEWEKIYKNSCDDDDDNNSGQKRQRSC